MCVGLVVVVSCGIGCAHRPTVAPIDVPSEEAAIRAVLATQVAAWNRADLAGFMEGYAPLDSTRFDSGGTITLGWQKVFDRYRTRYTNAIAMGHVAFTDVDVTVFSLDAAFATGRWRLERAGQSPSGLFTLLFRRLPAGWRIVYDHTSAAEP